MAIDDKPFRFEMWIYPIKRSLNIWHEKMITRDGSKHPLILTDDLGVPGKPGKIISDCNKIAKKIKKHFSDRKFHKFHINIQLDNGQTLINYYLAAAIYIRAFLFYPPFVLDNQRNQMIINRPYTGIENEYYILMSFLPMFFRGINRNLNGVLLLGDTYQNQFINDLTLYKNDIRNFEPISFAERLIYIQNNYFRDHEIDDFINY